MIYYAKVIHSVINTLIFSENNILLAISYKNRIIERAVVKYNGYQNGGGYGERNESWLLC